MPSRRLRVLFLASYFPKPDNPLMGTWALSQAQALARQDVDLLVASFTSWIPKSTAVTSGAKAYANCPSTYTWTGNVEVRYPRWLYYPVKPLKQWAYTNPTPYLKAAWWSAKQELCQLVQQFQPDVIFCHHSLPNGWVVTQLPTSLRRPLITMEHDFDEVADCHRLLKRKATMATVIENSWAVLAVSNRMKLSIQQLFPGAKVITHHLGVDLLPQELFKNVRPSDLTNRKIILSCALFSERKGIPLLVEAFHQVAPKHPDAILRIIGSGPDEFKIRSTIEKLNLGDRVQMVGKKLHYEVLQEMVWADCFALVGWDEPLGAVYLEAMMAGKAIICSADGGINDVIEDRIHGFSVSPKNVDATAKALDQMLGDDAKRVDMGNQAQRLMHRELTWDKQAENLLELFALASGKARKEESIKY